mmetsp:Transcript_11735/g.40530  ORF Transcript_11735/g.40530 Transcript_11735/m.40530 type:complete len:207 (-) Transcript_11735:1265-1885(-)
MPLHSRGARQHEAARRGEHRLERGAGGLEAPGGVRDGRKDARMRGESPLRRCLPQARRRRRLGPRVRPWRPLKPRVFGFARAEEREAKVEPVRPEDVAAVQRLGHIVLGIRAEERVECGVVARRVCSLGPALRQHGRRRKVPQRLGGSSIQVHVLREHGRGPRGRIVVDSCGADAAAADDAVDEDRRPEASVGAFRGGRVWRRWRR